MKQIQALFFLSAFLLAACQSAQNQALPADWATDRDLVCDMKVKFDTPDTVHYQGKVYGFCSPSCKDEFAANPASFVAKPPEKQ